MDGKEYELKDKNFPTIDPEDPYKLTKEEEYVMDHLVTVFKYCAYLQEHVRFLFAKGNLYKVFNGMLLYHGCVPLNEDGTFREVEIEGRKYAEKNFMISWNIWQDKGIMKRRICKIENTDRISCGSSGLMKIHLFMEKQRWQRLKGIFWMMQILRKRKRLLLSMV